MPRWSDKERCKVVRQVKHDEVKCYIEWEFNIIRREGFDSEKYKRKEDPYSKTFVINCGMCDGEDIDLFDLQDWFDKNREWINSLREEIDG